MGKEIITSDKIIAIRRLRRRKYTIQEISRITGISKRTIQRYK